MRNISKQLTVILKSSKLVDIISHIIYFIIVILLLMNIGTQGFYKLLLTGPLLAALFLVELGRKALIQRFRKTKPVCIGYTELYFQLIELPPTGSLDVLLAKLGVFYLLLTISCIPLLLSYFFLINVDGFLGMFAVAVAAINLLISMWIFVTIFAAALLSSVNHKVLTKKILANLFFSQKSPYLNASGLKYADLQKLKVVAEIEQSSADWRSANVSIALVWAFTIILWLIYPSLASQESSESAIISSRFSIMLTWITNIVGWTFLQVINSYKSSTSDGPFSSLLPNWGAQQSIYNLIEISLLWIVLILMIVALIRWVITVTRYISSEAINRLILHSCQEGISLLEVLKYQNEEILNEEQYSTIAAYLEHKLVSIDSSSWAEKVSSIGEVATNNLRFYVLPINSPTFLLKLIGSTGYLINKYLLSLIHLVKKFTFNRLSLLLPIQRKNVKVVKQQTPKNQGRFRSSQRKNK